jgi:hypothetical protein
VTPLPAPGTVTLDHGDPLTPRGVQYK